MEHWRAKTTRIVGGYNHILHIHSVNVRNGSLIANTGANGTKFDIAITQWTDEDYVVSVSNFNFSWRGSDPTMCDGSFMRKAGVGQVDGEALSMLIKKLMFEYWGRLGAHTASKEEQE